MYARPLIVPDKPEEATGSEAGPTSSAAPSASWSELAAARFCSRRRSRSSDILAAARLRKASLASAGKAACQAAYFSLARVAAASLASILASAGKAAHFSLARLAAAKFSLASTDKAA